MNEYMQRYREKHPDYNSNAYNKEYQEEVRSSAILNNKRWTEEEEKILKHMYAAGYSQKDIAIRLGRTWYSIGNKINRLKLNRRNIKS